MFVRDGLQWPLDALRDDILTHMAMRRVLLYDDVAVYGGHEEMTLNALRAMALAGDFEIGFVYSPANKALESRLKDMAAEFSCLVLLPFPYTTGSLQFLRTPLSVAAFLRLRKLIRNFRPACVLAIQGEISLSSLGVMAARCEKIFTLSYIPLAQSRHEREGGVSNHIKDILLWPYYRLPDAYITISDAMAALLRERGVIQPISVVENGIDLSKLVSIPKADARRQLGLPQNVCIAGLVGRVESWQKGHDILLHAIAHARSQFQGWRFLIVGDGLNKDAVMAASNDADLQDVVEFLPWQKDLAAVYSSLDLLVLPSRFEGVPVVMLEAMYSGLPVVASDRDAMHDLLPSRWLFPAGNAASLAATLLRVAHTDESSTVAANRQQVVDRFTLSMQAQTFCQTLRSFIDVAAAPRNIATSSPA